MDKPKGKNSPSSLRYYWYFFIPLTVILSLMIFFPLRIVIDELLYDTIFYGVILLFCIASTVHIYLRFRERSHRLVAVLLLCTILSGWQVFDIAVLRTGGSNVWMHKIYYGVRFQHRHCQIDFSERLVGNHVIAIAYDVNRNDLWPNCGG